MSACGIDVHPTADAALLTTRKIRRMAECPKCAAMSDDEAVECPQCGVVFAKFQQRHAVATLDAAAAARRIDWPSAALRDPTVGLVRFGLVALLAGLFIWTVKFARAPMSVEYGKARFLHLPDFVFHEAGHVVVRASFGRFMTVLGGSLFQSPGPADSRVAFLQAGRQRSAGRSCACGGPVRTCSTSRRTSPRARPPSWCSSAAETGAEVEGSRLGIPAHAARMAAPRSDARLSRRGGSAW